MFLCEVPSSNVSRPHRYAIPLELVGLLHRFDGGKSVREVIVEHLREYPESHSAESLDRFVRLYCVPKQMLLPSDSRVELLPPPSNRSDYVNAKFPLLSAKVVSRISRLTSWLFHPKVAAAVVPLIIASLFYFFLRVIPGHRINVNDIQGFEFLKLLAMMSAFSLAHELGHAAALAHFGHARSSIGWGIYIVYPVLYTDLSDAWYLSPFKRAVVDLGGVYFHGLALILLCVALAVSAERMLMYYFFGITAQIISSMNPFLRMDAFWLVSDLFGVSDLRKQMLGTVARFLYRVCPALRRHGPHFGTIPLKPTANAFLLIYSSIAVCFFGALYPIALYQLAFNVLPAYAATLKLLWVSALVHPAGVVRVVDYGIAALWKGLAVLGFLTFVWRMAKHLGRSVSWVQRRIGRWWRDRAGAVKTAKESRPDGGISD